MFAFANSVGNTAGVFVPELAGLIVKNPYDREQWTPFWLTTAAIMGSSGLIFLIFGVTRRQEFGPDIMKEESVEQNLIELPSGGGACDSFSIELPLSSSTGIIEKSNNADRNNRSFTTTTTITTANNKHSHLN